ncbi:DUF362 domain-containing protein [candidate division KSB1 bacterium]|nr:DUF362 domain-containing protein [candidate division KSB1 bacterium]
MERREFLKKSAATGLLISAADVLNYKLLAQEAPLDFVVIKNGSPAQLVRKAVEELGGMGKFVSKGQAVLLKPNIGWDRTPEQAANTNPEAVAEVVKMCLDAGAKRVRVLDRTCNQSRRCYQRSGIESAAKKAGAEVRHIVDSRFSEVNIPEGELLKSWPLYRDVLEFDVFINMPIAKHHTISGITLGFKNMMGIMGDDRGKIHKNFHTNIVDINTAIKPTLTIIDAYRILVRNGPTGGNLDDVEIPKVVIAGTDRVAIDAYAVTLFGKDAKDIEYIQNAHKRGLGQADLSRVKMKEIDLSA